MDEGWAAIEMDQHHAHRISIVEAILLSVVTLVAAWSGYSAAKWTTESRLEIAQAATARAEASRAFEESLTLRAQDASDFNAWFAARLDRNADGQRVAQRRFRSEFDVAFRAWLATKPFVNSDAPKGPQYMPQYRPAGAADAKRLDAKADASFAQGQKDGETGDKYIRVTVVLASVLFIVGIASHFSVRSVRIALVAVGGALLLFAGIAILQLPGPPS